MTQPHDVLYASKLFQEWLTALKERAMLQTHNQSQAMFHSVLHNVRRHMTTEQVLTFADLLPSLPRGIFIEGWRPTDPLPIGSADDLLQEVVQDLSPHHVAPDSIVRDVFDVLAEHSEPRAATTMKEQLPEQLRSLWPSGDKRSFDPAA
jgi:uncharacterized protein (DUF2267 family)